MILSACLLHKNVPVRLVSSTLSHTSKGVSASSSFTGPPRGQAKPALFTRISSRLNFSNVRLKRSLTSCSEVTSALTAKTFSVGNPSLTAAASTSDCVRSQITTFAPSSAKAWSISQPRPLADPVIRATLSLSFIVKPDWMLYIATASIVRRADPMQARMRRLRWSGRYTRAVLVVKRESRQKLMKGAVLALWFFVLFPPSLPAQTQKPLLLGLASISGGIETLYVTKKIGAFKRNGLDVDFLLLQGGSQALQVLLSGEIRLVSGGGGTAAQRARFKGGGNVIVATYTPTMPYSLYVNGKIQDAKRLKGAKIAISRFGSSSDFAARFMVSRLGLDPRSEEHTSELQSLRHLVCRLLLEKKNT